MTDVKALWEADKSIVIGNHSLFEGLIRSCFVDRSPEILREAIRAKFGLEAVVGFYPGVPPLAFYWEASSVAHYFAFTSGHDDAIQATSDRWLTMCPAFVKMSDANNFEGRILIDLSDGGREGMISFCSHLPGASLIPDNYFLGSHGYSWLRAQPVVPWEQREGTLFWRGSATGVPKPKITDNQRVWLCILARDIPHSDIGITEPWFPNRDEIAALGLERPFVGYDQFSRYKYQIDIDGSSNSWPGLFSKLLSGGTVLKVASPAGYRQWYYDRLVPWENYIPVRSDMTDLAEVYARVRADDVLAKRIGEAGRALAMSLTYEDGLETVLQVAYAHPRS